MSQPRIALVVLFFAALLVPSGAANASYTVLCTTYTGCADKGYSHAGYATAKSTSYWGMYTGTNCTNYVAYRLITTNGMSTTRPKPGVGNARDWGTAMASVTDQTPAVGAVAWWGKTGNHVAYIEKVVSSTEIWVSESNWSGAFDWRKITKSGSGWPDGIIHFTSAAPATSSKPTILGTPQVGVETKLSIGTWNPAPTSYSYQWLLNGTAISGATATTYKPTSAALGKALSVQVSGSRSGSATVRVASDPITVAPGTLTSTARPRLSGTAQVGSTLTATPGTWSRTDVAVSYQWFSGATAVPGATGSTYAVRASNVGTPVTAQVTATRAGFTPAVTTTPVSSAVAPGTLTRRSVPSISGTPRVGAPLTASPGSWSPSATPTFQWLADGRAVAGATAQTFTPTARQRRATITVRVVARREGYAAKAATSSATRAVATGRLAISRPPRVTGSAGVGSTLTVSPGVLSPATASARYQWLRDGRAIAGATGRTRKVSTNDVGRRLSVRVSYKAAGYSPATVTTASTRRARAAARLSVTARPSSAGAAVFTVRVSASTSSAPTGRVTVTGPGGVARTVTVSKGRATARLTGLPAGRQSFTVAFGGSSAVAGASVTKIVVIG